MEARIKPPVLPEAPKYECKRHTEPPRPIKLDYRPRKRLPHPTSEEVTRIREMMEQGKNTKEIAEAIGKPDYTIRRYKRQIRAGITGKEQE